MLKVFDQEFPDFDAVVQWAWNTYKIVFEVDEVNVPPLSEEEQVLACSELETLINDTEAF